MRIDSPSSVARRTSPECAFTGLVGAKFGETKAHGNRAAFTGFFMDR
jgi:hypothetical protein